MDEIYDKIIGNLMPGSHVKAIFSFGEATRGYVFMPDGTPDGSEPSDVMLDGWVHFPEVECGDGTSVPIRKPLSKFLEDDRVDYLVVAVTTKMTNSIVWTPKCHECDAAGLGEVTPQWFLNGANDGDGWKCLCCEATFEKPIKQEIPLSEIFDQRIT